MKGLYMKGTLPLVVFLIVIGGFVPGISGNIEKTHISMDTTFEYIIITDKNLENSNFQLLVNHKSQYLTAKIVKIEDIISNPDYWVDGLYGDATSESNGNPFVNDGEQVTENFQKFNDTQAKIRNFIRYAYLNWDTRYVLLGGDVQIIPVRTLRIHDALWFNGIEYQEIDADIRSDLYYAGLDGTWNNDFDEYWGEEPDYSTGEEADFIAEVYVGRAPVDNKNDVITFVNKVISFETTIRPKDIQLHQAGMNQYNVPDSKVIPEACADLIPSDYNIHKLYQVNEDVTLSKWIKAFKEIDKLIFLHVGSGLVYFYYLQRGLVNDIEFNIDDVKNLGESFYPIHMSVSCCSGDFGAERDCLAEELLLWKYGGPSACIFNTYYGFASHKNALNYSGQYIVQQFDEIFNKGTENLGKIVQFAKEHYVEYAYTNHGDRWCFYTINLLGDPETPIFEKREKPELADKTYVDDDFDSNTEGWGVDHFNNLQLAINSVVESGVVNVNPGEYNENLLIEKTVTIIGEKPETTIINGGDNEIIIDINANSVKIENFTIKNTNDNPNMGNQVGIMISPNCDGNEIYDNIIKGKNQFGILIIGSCQNRIQRNIIESSQIGIAAINPAIINQIESIIPTDNIIRKNTIKLCEKIGVYFAFANDNHIWSNKFIDNKKSEDLPGINPNAFFIKSNDQKNDWGFNYWGEPAKILESIPIYGRAGPIEIFSENIEENINLGQPSVEYDTKPRSKTIIETTNKGNINNILLFDFLDRVLSGLFKNLRLVINL